MKIIDKIKNLEYSRFKVFIKNEENKNKFLEANDEKYEEEQKLEIIKEDNLKVKLKKVQIKKMKEEIRLEKEEEVK